MKNVRRLEAPAAKGLFHRIQRSPLRSLDPRFIPEERLARLEREHPELVAAEENAAMMLSPWGDWLWLVYGFAHGDAVRQRFQPLLARLEGEAWLVRGKAYEALVAILDRNAPQPEAQAVACEPQTVPGPWDS